MSKHDEKPCPNCGHCPTCGRSNQQWVWPYGRYPYIWQHHTSPLHWAGGNSPNQSTSGGTGAYSAN